MEAANIAWIDQLKFNEKGLIPAIIQDAATGQVLMMAWMNRDSLKQTIQLGKTVFWSRSRQKYWIKGETSGHYQWVKAIKVDCDADTLLIQVEQEGAACHEGYRTCFYRTVNDKTGALEISEDTHGRSNPSLWNRLMDPLSVTSREYWLIFLLLLKARAFDFFSTWLATPTLALEANPIVQKLGWKKSMLLNVLLVPPLALFPLPALMVITASVLAAARNLHVAWMARAMGERRYSAWVGELLSHTSPLLFKLCVAGSASVYIALGVVLWHFSQQNVVCMGVGGGLVAYGCMLGLYTLLRAKRIVGQWRKFELVRATQTETHPCNGAPVQ